MQEEVEVKAVVEAGEAEVEVAVEEEEAEVIAAATVELIPHWFVSSTPIQAVTKEKSLPRFVSLIPKE